MNERQQEADYIVLQRLMANLVQSQTGRPIEDGQEWLNDAQTLARKMFEHLASMKRLTNVQGFEISDNRRFEFIDHASVKVIARAAFETYLVFFFIYGDSNRSLSEFRHKIWRYAGLADRQKTEATSDWAREVKAVEKVAMERLKSEIETSAHLNAYSRDAQRRILKGEWRGTDSWNVLGRSAGFHEDYFRHIYGYLCGYSHASYISALQIGQAYSLDHQRGLADSCIGIGVVLMAHFSRAYIALFGDARSILEADSEGMAAVARWRFSPEDWDKMIAKRAAS